MIWILNDNNNTISHGYVWDVANIVAYISIYSRLGEIPVISQ